jgi:hypothetical protein
LLSDEPIFIKLLYARESQKQEILLELERSPVGKELDIRARPRMLKMFIRV